MPFLSVPFYSITEYYSHFSVRSFSLKSFQKQKKSTLQKTNTFQLSEKQHSLRSTKQNKRHTIFYKQEHMPRSFQLKSQEV